MIRRLLAAARRLFDRRPSFALTGDPMPTVNRPWTVEEIILLRERYPRERTADIAADLGRSLRGVQEFARRAGMRKLPETIARLQSEAMANPNHGGRRTQRKPGQPSWNKGKSYQPGGRCRETQIKPGTRPHNAVPVGSETVNTDGYRMRKVAEPDQWRMVHHLLWLEAGNPPPPPGHALVFRDGNRANVTIDNIELVTRKELSRRNSRWASMPPELNELVTLRAAITRRVNNIARKEQSHE